MPIPFPTQAALCEVFGGSTPFSRPKPKAAPSSRGPLGRTPFSAWSAVEDAKDKAGALSAGAVKEFEKASSAVQAKAGKIELYSMKYYAACTLGGILACVRFR
jgi:solute carrier family 25 (mitochondrial phosphate transporter), member 3